MTRYLYVEGGGDSKALRTACRRGFSEFLKRAGMAGRMPRIVACGSRNDAYGDFKHAVEQAGQAGSARLLVDAEGPVTEPSPWAHLRSRDQWERPHGATEDDCHLMVQLMESWFLADVDALARFFGAGFRAASLPGQPVVEDAPKHDVLNGLKSASERSRRGAYDKGRHSFELLALLDPSLVRSRAPWAQRFLDQMGGSS